MRNTLHRMIMREAAVCSRMSPKPPLLTSVQRTILRNASARMENGESIPYCGVHLPAGWRVSLNGLVKRKLMDERKCGFFYITQAGRDALAAD